MHLIRFIKVSVCFNVLCSCMVLIRFAFHSNTNWVSDSKQITDIQIKLAFCKYRGEALSRNVNVCKLQTYSMDVRFRFEAMTARISTFSEDISYYYVGI